MRPIIFKNHSQIFIQIGGCFPAETKIFLRLTNPSLFNFNRETVTQSLNPSSAFQWILCVILLIEIHTPCV